MGRSVGAIVQRWTPATRTQKKMGVVSDRGTGRNILDSPGQRFTHLLEPAEVKKPGL